MFELVVSLCRYLFIFFITFFMFQTVIYVLIERNKVAGNLSHSLYVQRFIICIMHIFAYYIISISVGTSKGTVFDMRTLFVGLCGLVFITFLIFTTNIVYKGSCKLLWNCICFLFDVGLIMLQRLSPDFAERQLFFAFAGSLLMLLLPLVLKIIPRFEKLELVYLICGWVIIVLPFFFGEKLFGAVNQIKVYGVSFQPSEIVKFLFIFYLCSVFRKTITVKSVLFPAAMAAGYVMVLVAQTDLGGALIFFMTFMILFYIATGKELLFFAGIAAMGLASTIAYRLFSHIRVRVMAWQNPWADADIGGYQIIQSLFAITTFGFFGSGLTRGYPKSVPVYDKDFIFAAICEEFGSLFGILIICVFIVVFFRGAVIALKCDRKFYCLLASGVTSMLAFQTFLILGGVTKLIPLTGVTLPFISYGGSSIIVSFLMLGILQWIVAYYEKRKETEPEISEAGVDTD